jgi:hypothetical protein
MFISKIGWRPKATFQEAVLTGMVIETARALSAFGS